MHETTTGIWIELMGGLAVAVDGEPRSVSGDRQRRLLARLALSKGHAVLNPTLAEAVWGNGDPPDDPAPGLRTYVGRLRTDLGSAADLVETVDGGYRLSASALTDLDRFHRSVQQARAARASGRTAEAVDYFDAALSLRRGPLLAPWADEAWVLGEATRVDDVWFAASEERAACAVDLGRPAEAIEQLGALRAEHPHREGLARQLAVALHLDGRSGEALDELADFRRQMLTDLGLDPSPELAEVEAKILSHDVTIVDKPSHRLRSYELAERIGEGSFSIVYRGRQPAVDRDVAIKVIRADLANDPDFIRRFEAEARLIARLEHRSIVPLYDFWREPHAAYLVMRWLRGGTLESRLADEPLTIDESVTMVREVGAALAHAHARGIVHRDVKPANVFIDDDGHFYLGDFGIAVETATGPDPVAARSLGSPAYASPEQLRRESVGPATDVYGLAVTTFEALTGHPPFAETHTTADVVRRQIEEPFPSLAEEVPGLPRGVDQVLERATRRDPTTRTSSAAEFVETFCDALAGVTAAKPSLAPGPEGLTVACPYVGLAAFDEADADRYFGRERLVIELVARVAETRTLMLVGPSGSGKSSLVRAGLIPRLRAGGLEGSDDWFFATMTPGSHPFEELEAALLRIAVHLPSDLQAQLTEGEWGIARGVRRVLADEGELVLVIDQFEELFTHCTDEAARRRFLLGLVAAVADPRSRLRVVATCRADFYDHPLRYPELAPLLRDGTVPVTPLAPDELERVIVDPAARAGVGFEPGLVSAIVADVNDQPGALPLLQFSLTRLWDTQVDGLLTLDAYRRLGGVSGALAAEAEAVFADLPAGQRASARHVFGRLVTPGEGHADTRRRADRAELESTPESKAVVAAFGVTRLLAFDRDRETRRPTVEVAHEALLREWPRLAAWIDEDRERLVVHRHLTAAAEAWRRTGDDPAELYRGGRLDTAIELAEMADLTETEQSFLDASVAARERELEAERRRVARLRALLAVAASVAVVAIVAGLLAYDQQRRADREAAAAEAARAEAAEEATRAATEATRAGDEAARAEAALEVAEAITLVSRAEALATENPTAALLLAVEAYRRDGSPDAQGALLTTLASQDAVVSRVSLPEVAPRRCEGSPFNADDYDWPTDDGWAVFGRDDGVFRVDPLTGEVMRAATRPSPCARPLISHSDGPVVFQAPDPRNPEIVVLQPVEGDPVTLLETTEQVSMATSAGPGAVVGVVEVVSGELSLFDGRSGAPIAAPVESDLALRDLWFSPSGDRVLGITSARTDREVSQVEMLDARTGVSQWAGSLGGLALMVAFAPSEARVAVPTAQGLVEVLSVADGSTIASFRTEEGSSQSVTFLDDDHVAVMAGDSLEIRELPDGSLVDRVVVAGGEHVRSLGDGLLAVHSGDHDEITVVAPNRAGVAVTRYPLAPGLRAQVNEDAVALTDIGRSEARLIDLVTGATTTVGTAVPEAAATVTVIPLAPDGSAYVTVSVDGVLTRFVDGSPREQVDVVGPGDWFIRSGDGQDGVIAILYGDNQGAGTAALVAVDPLEMTVGPIATRDCLCIGIYPTPDGEGLVVEEAGTLSVYGAGGDVETSIDVPASDLVVYTNDPDRNLLFRGTEEGWVDRIDMTNLTVERIQEFGSGVEGLRVAPGGRLVVITEGGEVWLLDATDGERIGRLWVGGAGNSTSPAISGDGRVVWVVNQTEVVGLLLDPDEWVDRACALAGRELTAEEWDELVPGDEPQRPICPDPLAS